MPRRLLPAVAALLLFVGSCSSTVDEPSPEAAREPETSTTGKPSADDPSTVEEPVGELEVAIGPAVLRAEVFPVVRAADALVLTIDLTVVDDPADTVGERPTRAAGGVWDSAAQVRGTPSLAGLRLVDLTGDQVLLPGTDQEGDAVHLAHDDTRDGDVVGRVQVAYADIDVDEIGVFVPQAGLLTGVPVVESDLPIVGAATAGAEAASVDPATIVDAPVASMVSFSVELDGTARTEADSGGVTVALAADVLFAVDSADLDPAALSSLDAVVAELGARAPGPVAVVGHTDDTASDGYNLDLSQRRAAAVAAALAERIDADSYPLTTEGRGESEPVADNGTEEGRAQNRRVEVVLATEVVDDVAAVEEPAPFGGPTARGDDGVVVENVRPYRVRAPRASMVDGHLVVEVETAAVDDEVGSVSGPALFEGTGLPNPSGLGRLRTMAGVSVVVGSSAIGPVLHDAGSGMLPLTDLATFSRLDGGDARTSAIVYPRGVPVGDTVTIQLLDLLDPTGGWRLTDIPVDRDG